MRVYPVFIPHAGCPHRCLFCAQDRSSGQSEVPDVDAVSASLETMLPDQGDGEIAFYGGTFSLLPVDQQRGYLALARGFVLAGRVSGVRVSTRPDALDEVAVTLLRDEGVSTVEIGFQSCDDAVLKAAGRGHKAADNLAAVERCQQAGMQVGIQLMPGLPGADADEALESLQQALALKPAFVRIYPTLVIAGTELAELWRYGHFIPWPLDKAVDVCADMLYLCRRAAVPVIRLGLQGDPMLEKNLLAGPYHPAFGQLVRSRLWRRALARANRHAGQVFINPGDLSDVIGHRGENRDWLKEVRPELHVLADKAVQVGCLRTSGKDVPLIDLSA